jgi:hypothetical protein
VETKKGQTIDVLNNGLLKMMGECSKGEETVADGNEFNCYYISKESL